MRRPSFPTVLVGQASLLREGLARIIGVAGFRVVASVSSIHELADSLVQHQSIFLIIDSGADPRAAAEHVKLFKEQHPASRVGVLLEHYQLSDIFAVFQAGANVCLAKTVTPDAFIKTLELVMLGETI